MSMQLLVSALVSVAMVAPASPAAKPAAGAEGSAAATTPAADDGKLKRAEELFLNGRQLFKEGSYEAAILAFQESYDLSKLPEILYNIGNSYEKLGDFANARKYLDQYRAFAPEKERELLGRRIQNLDQRLREQEDKARVEREKQAEANKQPEPGPVAPPVTEPEPKPEPRKDRVFGPAAGVLTGVAVLGLGLGIGFGVSAQSQRNKALDHCSDGDGQTFCGVEAQPFLDAQKSRALGADISFGIAGAAAIAVIVLVAVKASKKKNDQRASLTPWGGPRGAGLALGFRF